MTTAEEAPAICSAKGCQAPAAHELGWNNPKLHTPDRRKVWLAVVVVCCCCGGGKLNRN